MARYIDAEGKTFPTSHRKILNDYMNGWNTCLKSVLQQPTADVVEVRHGRWEYDYKDLDVARCSLCNFYCQDKINNISVCFHYCPNCGAKMDKGEENDRNN